MNIHIIMNSVAWGLIISDAIAMMHNKIPNTGTLIMDASIILFTGLGIYFHYKKK